MHNVKSIQNLLNTFKRKVDKKLFQAIVATLSGRITDIISLTDFLHMKIVEENKKLKEYILNAAMRNPNVRSEALDRILFSKKYFGSDQEKREIIHALYLFYKKIGKEGNVNFSGPHPTNCVNPPN